MTTKNTNFIVSGIRTGTCIACDKETQVFAVVFRDQAMNLCPRDFFKQVRIAGAAADASPNPSAVERGELS
jgi:hypothetical protein